MTAKEKATELRFRYWKDGDLSPKQAKQCAIIAVSEIIEAFVQYGYDSNELQNMDREINWWLDVKNELNKM